MIWRTVPSWEPPPYRCVQDTTFWPTWLWRTARGQGLGSELLAVAEAQAVRLGAKELWLVGKVPDFYRQFHWVEVPREDAPPISKCLTCDQFQVDCFPSIMRKVLPR